VLACLAIFDTGLCPARPRASEASGNCWETLSLVDVRLLDHLVVCVGECTSFAERGLL
jgi:hypothetical protein